MNEEIEAAVASHGDGQYTAQPGDARMFSDTNYTLILKIGDHRITTVIPREDLDDAKFPANPLGYIALRMYNEIIRDIHRKQLKSGDSK